MFSVPDEERFFLFDILRTVPHEASAAVLAENRRLYEQSRDLGGKLYTISAVEMSQHDWKEQFRPFWGRLVSEKSRHDPDNVLGPGPGVFA
jgi:cytokinin dehydrogenase